MSGLAPSSSMVTPTQVAVTWPTVIAMARQPICPSPCKPNSKTLEMVLR